MSNSDTLISDPARTIALPADSPRAVQIVLPPPSEDMRDGIALEGAMQTLALPGPAKRVAIALELVGTSTSRAFIARAASPAAFHHISAQLQTCYPHAEIQPLAADQDPFRLDIGETVSVRELRSSDDLCLPLRTWTQANSNNGSLDPLLSILAGFNNLPSGVRAIAQLAMLPAPADWAQGYDQEMLNPKNAAPKAAAPSTTRNYDFTVIFMVPLLLLGFVLWMHARAGGASPASWISPVLWGNFVHLASGSNSSTAGGNVDLWGLTGWIIAVIVFIFIVVSILYLLMHGGTRLLQSSSHNLTREPIYNLDLIKQKMQQAAYYARLRLYVIGRQEETPEQQRDAQIGRRIILDQLTAAYRQFDQPGAASLEPHTPPAWYASRLVPLAPTQDVESSVTQRIFSFGGSSEETLRQRNEWTRGLSHPHLLLSLSEIISLWHFPQAQDLPDIPYVLDHAQVRRLPVPRQVTSRASSPLVVGHSQGGGQSVRVQLTPDMLSSHSLIAGRVGAGKSTLLFHMARLALQEQQGHLPASIILLDPSGDIVDNILGIIPLARYNDVNILDLSDTEYPIGLNLLDTTLGRSRDKATESTLQVLASVWSRYWGPSMENILCYTLKTLYEANETLVSYDTELGPDQQYTMLDIAPLLTDTHIRRQILQQVQDTVLLRWWESHFDRLSLQQQQEVTNPILTRIDALNSSEMARNVIGQSRSTLDMTHIVQEGQILLVNLAKRDIGGDTAGLVGSTILGLLQNVLREFAFVERNESRHFYILIDEFQAIPWTEYANELAESRNYGASFALATQSLDYLTHIDPTLCTAVMSNAENIFSFRVNAKDAQILKDEFDGAITVEDLTNLEPLNCYAKLTLNGSRLPVFSLTLDPPQSGDPEMRQRLYQASREKRAHPKKYEEYNELPSIDEWPRDAEPILFYVEIWLGAVSGSPDIMHESHAQSPEGALRETLSTYGIDEPVYAELYAPERAASGNRWTFENFT